ncbi:hypothetical protein GQ44DRAFT_686080 [Phaeosphaeriaceae sp. PMI808]|nr:hypothetical protein GQ44DRAFT_686080 [Phaeosphaeriaceae sp. PMI808]
MSIPMYDDLVYFATPPNSYVGAAIFLAYIATALYATFNITYSLYTQYNHIFQFSAKQDESLKAAKAARARHIKIYAFLASISFSVLSYHMVSFLIEHYLEWSGDKTRDLSAVSIEKIKSWMLDSTLFLDFARDLVENRSNAVWAQFAILGTWFWNVWMARKARARGFDTKMMQNFVLLSQILPISFTVCLFLMQLHLSSPDIQDSKSKKNTSAGIKTVYRKPIATLHLPNIILNACLLGQPSLRNHSIFSTILGVERFLLLLPHSGLLKISEGAVDKCFMVALGFVGASQYAARKELRIGAEVKALLHGGAAVKVLGWDAILGAVVWLCLTWGGGV